MGYVVAAVLLFLGLWFHYKDKTWISPECFYCYYWFMVVLFASLQLFDLYAVNNKVWYIVLVGSLSFVLGARLTHSFRIVQPVKNKISITSETHKYFFSPKIFWIVTAILYFYAIIDFIQAVRLMAAGVDLSRIRSASYGLEEINGYSLRSGLLSIILTVIRFMIVPTGIEFYVSDYKKNYLYLIAVLSLSIIISFSDGGRINLVFLVLQLVVCFSLYQKKIIKKLSPKMKKNIIKVILLLSFIVLVISLIRGIDISEMFKGIYAYMCGNIIFLDLNIAELDLNGTMTFGFAGMYGIWSLLFPFFSKFSRITYPIAYYNAVYCINSLQSHVRFIGDATTFNSFCTPFYCLYADFRWLGIILGMFIFGLIVGYVYKLALLHKNAAYVLPYLFSMHVVFKTFKTYPGADSTFILIIIFMLIKYLYEKLLNKKVKYIKNQEIF